MYDDQTDGLQGKKDVGQMSVWYVRSALSFYPVDPVSGNYILGSPLFEHATLDPGSGKKLEIEVRRSDASHQYVQSSKLNGNASPP
jgi:putative alpha-1,2-mannosidase